MIVFTRSKVDRFLHHLRCDLGLSENTILAYRSDLHTLVPPDGLGGEPVMVVLSDAAKAAVESLREPSSRRRRIACYRRFAMWCSEHYGTNHSWAGRLIIPRLPERLPSCPSIDEIRTLLCPEGHIYDRLTRLVLELLYGTGIRVSELCSLRLSSVDRVRGSIKVRGKGNKERLIPLNQRIRSALFDFMDSSWKIKEATSDLPLLRQAGSEYAISPKVVRRILRFACERAGIPRYSPHALRHAFATHLIDSGADLRVVQELLGHASVDTTALYLSCGKERVKSVHQKAHPGNKKDVTSGRYALAK